MPENRWAHPESTYSIRVGCPAHHPAAKVLQLLLEQREMCCLINGPRTGHHIRPAVQSCHKPFGKSFILFETDNMVHAPSSCHLHRIVPAAVIDDQIFDFFNSLQCSWEIIQCDLQRLRLVIAGDLH